MILTLFYSIFTVIFLSQKSPKLFKILNKNTKKIHEKKK